jgi:hypothetical protein
MPQALPTEAPPLQELNLFTVNLDTKECQLRHAQNDTQPLRTLCASFGTQDIGLAVLLAGYQCTLTSGKDAQSVGLTINNATAFVQALNPQTPVEAMLAQQMLAVHHHTIEASAKASRAEYLSQSTAYLKQLNQLACTFAKQAEAFHKLRHGGKQTVQVVHQHVQAEAGSQVMVAQKA